MPDNLNEFRESVEYFTEHNINEVFFNEGAQHASIVLESLASISKKVLCIYSGSLEKRVWDAPALLKNIKEAIDKKVAIRILVDNEVDENSYIYELVKEYIRPAPLEFKGMVDEIFEESCHFTLADKKAYRIETDADNYKADCNVNDPTMSKPLTNIFLHFWNMG